MNFPNSNLSSDLPLVGGISSELLSRRADEDAVLLDLFDSAHLIVGVPTQPSFSSSLGVKQMDSMSSHSLESTMMMSPSALAASVHPVSCSNPAPDLYQEDDSDVGPRILSTPICLDVAQQVSSSSSSSPHKNDMILIESAAALFNQALFRHVKGQLFEAKHMYHSLVNTVQNLLRGGGCCSISMPSAWLLEMGMRVHNNLGLLMYNEGDDIAARTHFQAALLFSKQLIVPLRHQQAAAAAASSSYHLEHATILSNWCRVNWMRGDISDNLYTSLREILRIRSSLLSWDHPDIAAAHFNLAVAEYARQMTHKAVAHLMQYLHVAAHHRSSSSQNNDTVALDPMPALIYLLLLQNEDNDDSMSQELVRGLRTLQDKRSCSSNSSQDNAAADVGSVLNFIGTLLFHKQDLEHALLFFQEELRLEEQILVVDKQEDISVSVTCNNIGRILQELDKFEDAIVYYERALKAQYGDCIQYKSSCTATTSTHPDAESSSAAANLYSTVWYNLGLIHDKRGCYAEAIVAFKMSLELRSSMLGRDHPDIACLYYNIGVLQMEQQQLTDASDSLREALRVRCQQDQQGSAAVAVTASGGSNSNGASNQLNDERVIKTLEKLASLHKHNGAIMLAIDALRQVIRILQVSTEYDTMTRMKDLGLVLRSIAELYHTMGDVNSALIPALHSVRQLEFVAVTMHSNNQQQQQQQHHKQLAHYFNIEQLISSLLLVGSLHHEMNEPIQADAIFRQAVVILDSTIIASSSQSSLHSMPSSLYALREVAAMLATTHCAPEA